MGYFSSENRTSRVKERAKKRAARRSDFNEREDVREKAGGLSFRKVGGAIKDVGLGLLGLTPKDKARKRKGVKQAKSGSSSGYSASYSASAGASTNKDGLMLAGAAVAALAVGAALMKSKGD